MDTIYNYIHFLLTRLVSGLSGYQVKNLVSVSILVLLVTVNAYTILNLEILLVHLHTQTVSQIGSVAVGEKVSIVQFLVANLNQTHLCNDVGVLCGTCLEGWSTTALLDECVSCEFTLSWPWFLLIGMHL